MDKVNKMLSYPDWDSIKINEVSSKMKSSLSKKYSNLNIDRMPINYFDGKIDFSYGERFDRDTIDESIEKSLISIEHRTPNGPEYEDEFIEDAISDIFETRKHIYPLIQVSKAGKSFAIRQLAQKRWILLFNLQESTITSKRILPESYFRECSKICTRRDELIKKNKNTNDIFEIHKECFRHCKDITTRILFAYCIDLLIYNEKYKNKKNCNKKLDYFDLSQTAGHQLFIQEIFNQLLLYDLNSIYIGLIGELKKKLDCVPIFVCDECSVLNQKNGNLNLFLSRNYNIRYTLKNESTKGETMKNELINDKTNEIIDCEKRALFDPFASSTLQMAEYCIPVIICGTTMRISRLIEGFSSPYKPQEMILTKPIHPLSPNNVRNIIEDYLNIKLDDGNDTDEMCKRWSGRAGLLIDGLIMPFLKTSTNIEKNLDKWKNLFIKYENMRYKKNHHTDILLRYLTDDIVLKQSISLKDHTKQCTTIGEALACVYNDITYNGPDYRSAKGYSNSLSYLIEYGLFYLTKYEHGSYQGSMVEPSALDALDLLFRKNEYIKKDWLYSKLKHDFQTEDGDRSKTFEKYVSYILIRECGKKLGDISFISDIIRKEYPQLSEYVLCGKKFEQEKSSKDKFVEKMINGELNDCWISSVRSHAAGESDLMGIAQNPNTQEFIILLIQCKCLSNGHNLRDSMSGMADIYPLAFKIEKQRVAQGASPDEESTLKKVWQNRLKALKEKPEKYLGIFVTGDANVDEPFEFEQRVSKYFNQLKSNQQKNKYRVFHLYHRDMVKSIENEPMKLL